LGALSALYRRFGDAVAFFVVYVREAHPEDGWVLTDNRDEGILVADPRTAAERGEVAVACSLRFELELPVLVDGIDDEVGRRYGGWPDRLYLIGMDGNISYQGGEGPFGFRVEELEAAIEQELGLT
jgi:Iodothyronine deiodinase